MEPDASWLEIYHNGWSTPEEYDYLTIWETPNGDHWVLEQSHNVFNGTHEQLYSATDDQVLELLDEATERFA